MTREGRRSWLLGDRRCSTCCHLGPGRCFQVHPGASRHHRPHPTEGPGRGGSPGRPLPAPCLPGCFCLSLEGTLHSAGRWWHSSQRPRSTGHTASPRAMALSLPSAVSCLEAEAVVSHLLLLAGGTGWRAGRKTTRGDSELCRADGCGTWRGPTAPSGTSPRPELLPSLQDHGKAQWHYCHGSPAVWPGVRSKLDKRRLWPPTVHAAGLRRHRSYEVRELLATARDGGSSQGHEGDRHGLGVPERCTCVQHLESMNITLFGKWVFEDVIR